MGIYVSSSGVYKLGPNSERGEEIPPTSMGVNDQKLLEYSKDEGTLRIAADEESIDALAERIGRIPPEGAAVSVRAPFTELSFPYVVRVERLPSADRASRKTLLGRALDYLRR